MSELSTERLHLRPYRQDEAHLIHALISDLRVFFWNKEPGTREEAQKILDDRTELYVTNGLGVWGVFDKKSDEHLGQVILQPLPETGEPEIGYHFRVEAQGNGYATEAAARLLDYGFQELRLSRIVAVVLPDNEPSQAVMRKLGLPYQRDLMKSDLLHNYFALERDTYLKLRA